MSDEQPRPERRRDGGLQQQVSHLAATLRAHIADETPMVARLGAQIEELREEHTVVRGKLEENTKLTQTGNEMAQQALAILTTFKLLGQAAKYLSALVAAGAGVWAAAAGAWDYISHLRK